MAVKFWKNLPHIPREQILQLSQRDRLEVSLRQWCENKKGQVGYCKNKSHKEEADQLYRIMQDWGF